MTLLYRPSLSTLSYGEAAEALGPTESLFQLFQFLPICKGRLMNRLCKDPETFLFIDPYPSLRNVNLQNGPLIVVYAVINSCQNITLKLLPRLEKTMMYYCKSTDHGSDDNIQLLCWFGLCYNLKHF